MKLCSVGDAVIHQLSGSHAMVPQIRVLPVKLPHAGCSHVVNSNLSKTDTVKMPQLRCLTLDTLILDSKKFHTFEFIW